MMTATERSKPQGSSPDASRRTGPVPTPNRGSRRGAGRSREPEPSRPDPLGPVRKLGESARVSVGVLALIGSLTAHGLFGAASATSLGHLRHFAASIQSHIEARFAINEVDLQPEPPPPEPEPEPPPPEPEPEPEPEPPRPPPVATPQPTTPEPPSQPAPATAEAAPVLTAPADPDEPLDLTGEGFISGEGTRFAGKVTSARGTSTRPGAANARPDGVLNAPSEGKGPPPKAQNFAKPASPVASTMQGCPFPPESDIEQVHHARVRLLAVIGTDGRAKSVTVLDDPGTGFGAAAKRCILGRGRFEPALDVEGRPVSGPTLPFILKFSR